LRGEHTHDHRFCSRILLQIPLLLLVMVVLQLQEAALEQRDVSPRLGIHVRVSGLLRWGNRFVTDSWGNLWLRLLLRHYPSTAATAPDDYHGNDHQQRQREK